MKGSSLLISFVLIILITITTAMIINLWMVSFSQSSTQTIVSREETKISCLNANLAFETIFFCKRDGFGNLYGTLINSGNLELEGIGINILYQNLSVERVELCISEERLIACPSSNVRMYPGQRLSYNLTINSNFKTIYLSSLECPEVRDRVEVDEIELRC